MGRMIVAATLAAVLLGNAPAMSQALSDEEMLTRFMAQRDVLRSAKELGTTRGLTIVTLGEETADTSEAVTVESADTTNTELKPLDPNMPLMAARFDPSMAVDVKIEFEFDSAAIAKSQQIALEQVCRVMTQAEEINLFRIVGHTDSSGSDEYNQRLSQLRAEEVGRYLVNDCGIAASRLEMVGYGERFLADTDDPAAASNRRVEFQAMS